MFDPSPLTDHIQHVLKPRFEERTHGHLVWAYAFVPILKSLPELPAYFGLGAGVEVTPLPLCVLPFGAPLTVCPLENRAFAGHNGALRGVREQRELTNSRPFSASCCSSPSYARDGYSWSA